MGIEDQIRTAMEQSKKNRRQLALKAGVPESALSRFFHRQRGLSVESMEKLAHVLGLEITARKIRKGR